MRKWFLELSRLLLGWSCPSLVDVRLLAAWADLDLRIIDRLSTPVADPPVLDGLALVDAQERGDRFDRGLWCVIFGFAFSDCHYCTSVHLQGFEGPGFPMISFTPWFGALSRSKRVIHSFVCGFLLQVILGSDSVLLSFFLTISSMTSSSSPEVASLPVLRIRV